MSHYSHSTILIGNFLWIFQVIFVVHQGAHCDFLYTYFIFQKCAQILTFDTKLNQIPSTFLWSLSFGLAYSLLNSAKLSCSSEVTLP